ncbi:hypothetical protein SAMN05216215_101339 [Saccharopolyspora shandongensis]|uniref:Uncharacterized protein n=1 Tax=Saccharopolyspora shandongensis TaxID=418495 RepID=A0A1H3DDB6_9PSEU|nr:hypothetical protein SAMN05216215_101339 [Saccharopolyspora shandongensis]
MHSHPRLQRATTGRLDVTVNGRAQRLSEIVRMRTAFCFKPDAVEGFLHGLREAVGGRTPPLAPRVPGGRLHELATGVGQRP